MNVISNVFVSPGATEFIRQGVAKASRVGPLVAHGQVHVGEGNDWVEGVRQARGGRRHRRRDQRRARAQEGGRWIRYGEDAALFLVSCK